MELGGIGIYKMELAQCLICILYTHAVIMLNSCIYKYTTEINVCYLPAQNCSIHLLGASTYVETGNYPF